MISNNNDNYNNNNNNHLQLLRKVTEIKSQPLYKLEGSGSPPAFLCTSCYRGTSFTRVEGVFCGARAPGCGYTMKKITPLPNKRY